MQNDEVVSYRNRGQAAAAGNQLLLVWRFDACGAFLRILWQGAATRPSRLFHVFRPAPQTECGRVRAGERVLRTESQASPRSERPRRQPGTAMELGTKLFAQ